MALRALRPEAGLPDGSAPPNCSARRFGLAPLIALALVALAFVPFGSAPADAAEPAPPPPLGVAPVVGAKVETFTLANGLEVVVIPDHRAQVVTHMVWYKVGSSDEAPGKSGIAHYLEHLMFKGTPANPGGAFSKIVAQLGGQENAFTSNDYTSYYQRISREHLGLMMQLEADRMANLVLTEAVSKPELQVVLEERSMRTDNDPSSQLSEQMQAALYLAHPYRIPVIGWRHEIETLTYKDALAFYNHYYTPNNAIVIVAGDVDTAGVKALAEASYGKVVRRAELGPRLRPQDPEPIAARTLTLADERVTQPSVREGWVVPSARTAKADESEALEVLSELLGSGSTSKLYRKLVVDQNLASSVGGYYQSDAVDAARIMFYGVPRDGVTLEALKAGIDSVIADVAANGVSDAELTRAKRKVVADAILAQDNQASLARIFGEALATGGSVADVQTWPSRIYAVKADDLKAVAQNYLTRDRSVSAYLVNEGGTTHRAKGAPAAGAMPMGGAIRATPEPIVTEDSVRSEP